PCSRNGRGTRSCGSARRGRRPAPDAKSPVANPCPTAARHHPCRSVRRRTARRFVSLGSSRAATSPNHLRDGGTTMHEPAVRLTKPGEIAGWPLLQLVYRTDTDRIVDLLPPGLEPLEPTVHINIYNVPVKGEPEYGVSTKVPATYDGIAGYYGLGLGIDQEA